MKPSAVRVTVPADVSGEMSGEYRCTRIRCMREQTRSRRRGTGASPIAILGVALISV